MLIKRAAEFASKYHDGQFRKWTGEPYIEHPKRVAAKVAECSWANEELIAAAWLHDTIEDCPEVSPSLLEAVFSDHIAGLVMELTNKSAKKWSREERKRFDRECLARASTGAKLIKLADRIDNLEDIDDGPSDFAAIYRAESLLLLEVLRNVYWPFEKELEILCQ